MEVIKTIEDRKECFIKFGIYNNLLYMCVHIEQLSVDIELSK